MLRLIGLLLLTSTCLAQPFTADEINAWKKQAANVTIVRDMWGLAHVYGQTDADAVFGLRY
ncbi:MAG: penicillin acylase family protein, partial [Bacteroidota bacterium]